VLVKKISNIRWSYTLTAWYAPNTQEAFAEAENILSSACIIDSFVVQQTFVLRMNICGKNRQLLAAAKRYSQC